MLKSLTIGGVAAAAILLSAGAGRAQTDVDYTNATAPLIVTLLTSRGLPAQIAYGKTSGNPYVRSKVDGFTFSVYLFACDKQEKPYRCKGIQFYSGYKMAQPLSLMQMNEWNRTKRYARGYADRDPATGAYNRARIEMDLSFSGGMTRNIFMAHFGLFRRLNKAFRQHIGFN